MVVAEEVQLPIRGDGWGGAASSSAAGASSTAAGVSSTGAGVSSVGGVSVGGTISTPSSAAAIGGVLGRAVIDTMHGKDKCASIKMLSVRCVGGGGVGMIEIEGGV